MCTPITVFVENLLINLASFSQLSVFYTRDWQELREANITMNRQICDTRG